MELAYAKTNNILFAKLVNAAGQTVEATIPATVAAAKDAQLSDKLTANLVNAPGADAWPIAGFTYTIVNKAFTDCAKAAKLAGFLNWALTNQGASDRASKLLYAPLPDTVKAKAVDMIKSFTCGGKPALGQ